MKKLLTILFLICCYFSFGQSTPFFFQRSSGVVTVQDVRLAARDNFYVAYNATDTSLNGGVDTLGAMLHVRFGALQGLWYRDSITGGGHRWIRTANTSDLVNYWQLSSNNLSPISTSYNVGIGIATPLYRFDVFDGTAGHLAFQNGRLTLYDDIDDQNIKIGFGVGSSLSGSYNVGISNAALTNVVGDFNIGIGSESLYDVTGSKNTSVGVLSTVASVGSDNTSFGYQANAQMYGINNVAIGSLAQTATSSFEDSISNTEVDIGTSAISGSEVSAFITSASLSVGVSYVFRMDFGGTMPPPFTVNSNTTQIRRGVITNSTTITFSNFVTFTGQGSGKFLLTVFNKQNNSIAIGYGVETTQSNEIAIGNIGNTVLRINQFVVDIQDMPAAGEVLTYDGTIAKWDTIAGGGGGAYSFLTPLSESGGVVSIGNSAADGATKGAAAFTAADFNASSGVISIDYTNGQAASTTLKGFLTNTDWNTFNNKVSTGLITASGLTISTATLAGRYSAGTGAIQEITLGSGLSLSGSGVLTASGSGGITTLNTLTAATQFFAIGSSGTSPSWSVSGGNTHSLNLPTTSATNTGLVTPTLYNSWTAKQDAITGAATTITTSNLTSNRALISSATGKVDVSSVTNTELGYVSGVTSAIQTQLNNKAPLVSKTFQALGLSGSDISWVYTSGYNATYTITADRDILVSGDADGDYGTLIITQNATGGWDLTVPNTDFLQDGINVVGQPFTIDLPDAANSVAIVSWVNHSGVRYWTFGYYHQ